MSRLTDSRKWRLAAAGLVLAALSFAGLTVINLETQVYGTLPASNGGTGNQFAQFSGPSASVKTYTLPDSSQTIETQNNKNAANGYAPLDASAYLPCANMPALTGDVTTTAGNCATTVAKPDKFMLSWATTTAPACANGGGTTTFLNPSGAGSTTEASTIRRVMPIAGTVRAVYVWLGGNVPAGESAEVKIVKSGVAQSTPIVTIAAAAASGNDTSNTLALAAGDQVGVQVRCSGGTTALNARASVSILIQP
jgi:hypothetical protein